MIHMDKQHLKQSYSTSKTQCDRGEFMYRYYRISLSGYGGDSAYIKLHKETYDYWNKQRKQFEDEDPLLDYILESEDSSMFDDIPLIADFLLEQEDADNRVHWRNSKDVISTQLGIDYRCTQLSVAEVTSHKFDSTEVLPILEEKHLADYAQKYPKMLIKNTLEDTESHYMLQVYSSEKGKFFDGVIGTNEKFDPSKLRFVLKEYFNGDYIIEKVSYDNNVVELQDQDIISKGVSVNIWKSR